MCNKPLIHRGPLNIFFINLSSQNYHSAIEPVISKVKKLLLLFLRPETQYVWNPSGGTLGNTISETWAVQYTSSWAGNVMAGFIYLFNNILLSEFYFYAKYINTQQVIKLKTQFSANLSIKIIIKILTPTPVGRTPFNTGARGICSIISGASYATVLC